MVLTAVFNIRLAKCWEKRVKDSYDPTETQRIANPPSSRWSAKLGRIFLKEKNEKNMLVLPHSSRNKSPSGRFCYVGKNCLSCICCPSRLDERSGTWVPQREFIPCRGVFGNGNHSTGWRRAVQTSSTWGQVETSAIHPENQRLEDFSSPSWGRGSYLLWPLCSSSWWCAPTEGMCFPSKSYLFCMWQEKNGKTPREDKEFWSKKRPKLNSNPATS